MYRRLHQKSNPYVSKNKEFIMINEGGGTKVKKSNLPNTHFNTFLNYRDRENKSVVQARYQVEMFC